MKVRIIFTKESVFFKNSIIDVTHDDITEVHYNYREKNRIAFESDTLGTGFTYALEDIEEFEATNN